MEFGLLFLFVLLFALLCGRLLVRGWVFILEVTCV